MIYELSMMQNVDRYGVVLQCANTYLYYHESLYYQNVVDDLLMQTKGKWVKAVKWFVTNYARAVNGKASGMKISLSANHYSKNDAGVGYKSVVHLISLLEQKGYIHIYKGYVESWKVKDGKRIPEYTIPCCIVFRKRLKDLWNSPDCANLFEDYELEDVVEIRDRETKEPLSLSGRNGINQVRKDMKQYNDSLEQADIQYNGNPIATVAYKRIYLDNMKVAGRLYAAGGGVQLLPQRIRSEHLTIDGEPVVELDYHAIHPSICYELLAQDGTNAYQIFGKDFSPYGADLSFVEVDQDEIDAQSKLLGKPYKPLRNLIKIVLLISINSLDERQAVSGISGKIGEDRRKEPEDQEFVGIIGRVPVKKVMDAVLEHNDLIRDNFYRDKGVILQKFDGDIMMTVISDMVQRGHTVLCYHDSAVCKKSAEQDLYQAMKQAWKDVLHTDHFCKIDRK